MTLRFAAPGPDTIPLHVLTEADLPAWLDGQPPETVAWVKARAFKATFGTALALPGPDGVAAALIGCGKPSTRARTRFPLAGGLTRLPAGSYSIVTWPDDIDASVESFGALMNGYRFDRYREQKPPGATLVAPSDVDTGLIEAQAAGEALTRDLINTPASDMGPAELEAAARKLADQFDARISVTTGDDLLEANFPMIHAVGRAAAQAPRLIDFTWGSEGPTVTLVGKGVCFDTGGLNLKPSRSMGLMKKDMGGAASVLGLAHMLMATGAKIKLRVLIPAVENAVSSNSFRPQDILTSRKGLTVEINNTDAEGRLVLADALALADEDKPELIVSMATLTGAARIAVGGDLAPFYTDDETTAAAVQAAAQAAQDPVWRMPFHAPYEKMIEPGIADLDNAPSGGFAGSITAALFLRRFATKSPRFVHFDIYGWQSSPAPARPKGGVGQGTRALFQALPDIFSA